MQFHGGFKARGQRGKRVERVIPEEDKVAQDHGDEGEVFPDPRAGWHNKVEEDVEECKDSSANKDHARRDVVELLADRVILIRQAQDAHVVDGGARHKEPRPYHMIQLVHIWIEGDGDDPAEKGDQDERREDQGLDEIPVPVTQEKGEAHELLEDNKEAQEDSEIQDSKEISADHPLLREGIRGDKHGQEEHELHNPKE